MRTYGQYCAVAKALDVVGDRWNLLIVRELMLQGPCRYTDLQNGLPGIATNLLSDRLKDLEAAGVVRREAAPPPVATILFELTEAGLELSPVLGALGQWGTRFMAEPTGDEVFRSHWLAYPVSVYLSDQAPEEPPVAIEVRTGDRPAVIAAAGGQVHVLPGTTARPDLVLEGPAPAVIGVLTGRLSLIEARRLGLRTTGSARVLERLRPEASSSSDPASRHGRKARSTPPPIRHATSS